jgi:hypothetical protein
MAETQNPMLALDAKDIPTRGAAARELGATGQLEHLDKLLLLATTDRSPGVRLSSATAAADILSRHRLPPRSTAVSAEQRERWLAAVCGVDPSINTGLFQVAAVLEMPGGSKRVINGLRDPRQDVRAGACVGLWRLAQCGLHNGDTELEARIVQVLGDPKLRVETRVEIARICSCVGYASARDAAESLAGETIRLTKEVADQVAARFATPPSSMGLWIDDGTDADEMAPKAKPTGMIAVLGSDDFIQVANGKVVRSPLVGPQRVLVTRRTGGDSSLALQVGTRTYWAADGDDICSFGDALLATGHAAWMNDAAAVLGTGAPGLRVRGVALLAAGNITSAIETLESAVAAKRVPTDTWWFLADALAQAGRPDEAKPHLEKYLAKAANKAPFVEEAKRRLG